ncbi:MAG: hypothetical protein DRR16_24605 [Candidatus Parabeggiatoa sp. nov. 3]|nr:MAG: hypothetical protein DRR00_27430 [Gammaproteobacteria bacterium]RKZ58664.1 MAG: hypothetical protein DRQ99_25050 [Gammaproteobacteria bacterium]RKZ80036.1 MAG: hypothetical protein DRR16_24605 [Gammaproteobacteria bacterium]
MVFRAKKLFILFKAFLICQCEIKCYLMSYYKGRIKKGHYQFWPSQNNLLLAWNACYFAAYFSFQIYFAVSLGKFPKKIIISFGLRKIK